MAKWQVHRDDEVARAIIVVSDALCSCERVTGIESVLIIRDSAGFVYRAQSGKPGIPDDITDVQLLASVNDETAR